MSPYKYASIFASLVASQVAYASSSSLGAISGISVEQDVLLYIQITYSPAWLRNHPYEMGF